MTPTGGLGGFPECSVSELRTAAGQGAQEVTGEVKGGAVEGACPGGLGAAEGPIGSRLER